MVTTRNMEEQSTRDLIRELQAQIEAQVQTIQAQAHAQQEMRRRYEEEMRALRAEREPPERSASNRENANEASHNHANPNSRARREPTPLQMRPLGLPVYCPSRQPSCKRQCQKRLLPYWISMMVRLIRIKDVRYGLPKEGYSRRSPERASRKDERGRGYSHSPNRHREHSLRGVIN
ncbi:hypothetical protein LR48_Vigan11g103400 [Vigna angularis]|uniref:Uncharacterized protein n=1 Tax=Phaseolus angularis TaxID=3914 RepID=A0A0L9VSG1_PHAAN|nr:hypothetical protein LR48_Vigan11g103400 [Vigna angularis]